MIYYHIAKKIPDAHSVNPNIPLVLSNIISKVCALLHLIMPTFRWYAKIDQKDIRI